MFTQRQLKFRNVKIPTKVSTLFIHNNVLDGSTKNSLSIHNSLKTLLKHFSFFINSANSQHYFKHDLSMIYNGTWTVHERYMNGTWTVHERYMNGTWLVHEGYHWIFILSKMNISFRSESKVIMLGRFCLNGKIAAGTSTNIFLKLTELLFG